MKHPDDAPDVLTALHSLRSLAHHIKATADGMRNWKLAVNMATISEEATAAIERLTKPEANEPTQRPG